MIKYLDEKDIIPENHHGGRAAHSTITAKAKIDEIASRFIEENEITATITTDLQVAFDCIDHQILAEKLKIIGYSDKPIFIMRSFLKNRKQFVELEGFKSATKLIGDYCVLQGTKKSGVLYTLFNLEIVFLGKIMKNPPLYKEITGRTIEEFEEEDQETVNFVDDSTTIIASNDPEKFCKYIHRSISSAP